MERYNFNWLNSDDDFMYKMVGISSLSDHQNNTDNVGANILDYLLFNEDNNGIGNQSQVQQNQVPEPSSNEKELHQANNFAAVNPQLPISMIEEKDNFITFAPVSTPIRKNQKNSKKSKSRGSIFITASPQTLSKKLRRYPGNPQSNSSDESSEDENSNTSSQMTSKEKRLHKNRISARNFRVRRKEFIKQLQGQVEEQAQTINFLKKENDELKKANEELMKHVLNKPTTPSFTSNPESFTSSSSGSEANSSPDAPPLQTDVQNQLNSLYDFSLFGDLQLSQPPNQPQLNGNAPDLFYLNHAIIPDWDISRVLGEKGEILVSEEEQQRMSRDLLHDYPLLAPALMSIILRHTLSIEYVAGIANDLKKELHKSENLKSYQDTLPSDDEIDKMKASMNRLKIDGPTEEDVDVETELNLLHCLLTDHYSHYAMHRAMGKTHKDAFERFKQCRAVEKQKLQEKIRKEVDEHKSNTLKNLHVYSRVAGDFLRYSQRMSRIRDLLKVRPEFKNRSQNTKDKTIENVEKQSCTTSVSN